MQVPLGVRESASISSTSSRIWSRERSPRRKKGAPPAWIAVAAHDPLRDDGIAYAAALREAGVQAQLVVHEDMTHSFLRWGGVVDRAHDVIAWLAAALR